MGALLAIVNPAAGGGRCGRRAKAAIQQLRGSGLDVDVVETQRPGEASTLAEQAWATGRRDFLAVGGDGTSYEVINGLFPAALEGERSPTLGFLPLGTGNSFLRDFTNDGVRYGIQALREGRTRRCDLVRLVHAKGELFSLNLLSMGFVADVNAMRQRRFRALGELGYVAAVILEMAGLHSRTIRMTVDGVPDWEPSTFLSFNNSRFTGGRMMMAPHAETADGLVDLIRVGAMTRWQLLAAFPRIFQGTHVQVPQVREQRVKKIEFDLDEELDVMVDGETLRLQPREIEVLPGVLEVRL